jgi:5-hydroxyisourate hydrolase
MGKLSTHVLDTTLGVPAGGLEIKLFSKTDDGLRLLKTLYTNSDGRTDEAFLSADSMRTGAYQLEFDVESYFKIKNIEMPFLKDVVIRFYIDDVNGNYHVPLLISPYSYSTYKGS